MIKERVEITEEFTQSIPIDIFLLIFEYLEESFLIHSIALVNKQWRQCAFHPTIWKSKCIKLEDRIEVVPRSFIEFIKQCHITKFTMDTSEQFNQFMLDISNVVTELSITTWNTVDSEYPEFPQLQSFSYGLLVESNGLPVSLILKMPKLTALVVDYTLKNDIIVQTLLTRKNLKKLRINYSFTEEQVVHLFTELKYLENIGIYLHETVTSALWNTVFQIEGVSKRLKVVELNQSKCADYQQSYNLTIKNLKCLTINGNSKPHLDLLKCSRHILEKLVILHDYNYKKIIEMNWNCPCLKYLRLAIPVTYRYIISLLESCNQTIETLILFHLVKVQYSPVYLNLPKIKCIKFKGQSSELYASILQNIDGNSLNTLMICLKETFSIVDVFSDIAPRLTNLRKITIGQNLFNHIPIVNLNSILELTIDRALWIDDELMNTLVKCSNLNSFKIMNSCRASADNWLVRLLNNCVYLTNIHFHYGCTSGVNFSLLRSHNYLRYLEIHYSSIQQNLDTLLLNTPLLKYIKCVQIPLGKYSHFLESINKYPVPKVELELVSDSEVFDHCYYLDNPRVRQVVLKFENKEFDTLTFDRLLLAILCGATNHNTYVFIKRILNPKIFLAGLNFDETELLFFDTVSEIQNQLLKDVVSLIRGISDDQKEILINGMTTQNNELMKEVCEKVIDRFTGMF
jgi:hypothetical protein